MAGGAGSAPARVAVLGGTGWAGRHVCAAFAARGSQVVAIARASAPHVSAQGFRALDVALAPQRTLAALLERERPDVVVNATDALNATDGWRRAPAELSRVNVAAVDRLLLALAAAPWRPRLVHLGTIHEYGPVPTGTSIDEWVDPRPANDYACTKLAGSRLVLDAAAAGEADAVVLRLANLCGPHPSPASFPGKLLRLLREAAAGRQVTLTVAEAARDFLDVRDAAEAVVAAATASASGRVVNVGSGRAVALRDLVAEFLAVAGLPAGCVVQQRHEVASLGGDWVRADIRLAARLLRWRPTTPLRESLRAAWDA